MVGELIWRRFRVRLSIVSVGRVLHRLECHPSVRSIRAYEQNPELVAEWKTVTYPKIVARAADENGIPRQSCPARRSRPCALVARWPATAPVPERVRAGGA
jgi:hypothetical protein